MEERQQRRLREKYFEGDEQLVNCFPLLTDCVPQNLDFKTKTARARLFFPAEVLGLDALDL